MSRSGFFLSTGPRKIIFKNYVSGVDRKSVFLLDPGEKSFSGMTFFVKYFTI
jgi:hypothetical protein